MTWPGEGLLIKLWETLAEKGVGGLLKPWQIKREARAQLEVRRIELVALAAAEREAEEIRAGRMELSESRIALALPESTSERIRLESLPEARTVVGIATANLIGDSIRHEVNIAKAITHAEADLKDDPQKPSERDVEGDWLYRWRDYAGSVSSNELQALWGRLLAGEIKSPGSFSYRTLDFIRNLTTQEAKQIERLSRFVITEFIAKSQQRLLAEEGLSFSELLKLQSLGILSGVEALGLSITIKSVQPDRFIKALLSHGRALIVTHDDSKKEFKLPVYIVTELGQQVMQLGKFEPNEIYMKAVGEELKRAGAKVSLASYWRTSEQEIQYRDEQVL